MFCNFCSHLKLHIMKKKQLKSWSLNKKVISKFELKHIVGGHTGGVHGGCITDNGCNTMNHTSDDPYKQCD